MSSKCAERKSVNKKIFCVTLCALLLTPNFPAQAQQPKEVARIGYLGNTTSTSAIDMKLFRECLSELGYIEGQNIVIEYRYFDGKVERLPELAAHLVRLNCEVIVATGNEAAGAAKNAMKETPIVIASTNEAVRSGFVASLARSGGNITGLTSMGSEIVGKRLEVLKEMIPKLSRVGFLWNPTSPVAADNLKETETVARSLRVKILSLEVKRPDDNERAFQAATNKRAEAILADGSGFFTAKKTNHRASDKTPASGDVSQHSVRRGRWTDDLRGRPFGAVAARRRPRG